MRWGNFKPTEYDVIRSGIVGNFTYITERYPKDKILLKRIQALALLCLQLGALVGSDKDDLDKLNEEIRKGRQ